MKKIDRNNNFAILHFLGACMVVYGHQWALFGLAAPGWLGNSVQTVGVKMIFVLTGYLITSSYQRDGRLGAFLKRRLIRIYPALTACLLFTALCLFSVSAAPASLYAKGAWRYLWQNFLLSPTYDLPGVFADNPYPGAINGSLWTMPIEVLLYFVVGALLWAGARLEKACRGRAELQRLVYAIPALALVLLRAVTYVQGKSLWYICWGTNWGIAMDLIPYMLIGGLYALYDLRSYCSIQVAALLLIVASCVSFRYYELLALLIIPYCALSFALCDGPLFAECFRRNNIAYGVYLWGFPVQQLLIYLLKVRWGWDGSVNLYFLLSLALTIVLALLSHRWIETPVEGFLRRKLIK